MSQKVSKQTTNFETNDNQMDIISTQVSCEFQECQDRHQLLYFLKTQLQANLNDGNP